MPVSKTFQDFANTPTRVVIFLFVALALIALMGVALTSRNATDTEEKDPNGIPQDIITLSPHTIVYGSWSTSASLITAYDLATGREGVIATLPLNIKKVSVISSDDLVYISDVDTRDHGQGISKYNLTTNLEQPVYRASEGYVIDDYVISENGQYLAIWEVQMHPESGTLLNGKSKVVTARVNSQTTNIIYEETASETNPVRYPRGILNDGTVFMDRFLPNSGAGWAYGMSVSNYNGSQKQDLTNMQNGTYSTQPVLSADEKYLAFAGYSGSNGDVETNGFRKAIIDANTVELLDTGSLQRAPIEGLSTNRVYSSIVWSDEQKLSFNAQGAQADESGLFTYDLTSKLVAAAAPSGEEQYAIQQLGATTTLVGTQNISPSAIGNLGKTYSPPYTSFAVYDSQTETTTPLQTKSPLMQLIAVLPSTSFASFETVIKKSNTGDSLQIAEFFVKSEIAPTRSEQQSDRPTPTPTKTTDTNTPEPSDAPRRPNSPTKNGLPKCKDLAREMANSRCTGLSNIEENLCYNRIYHNLLYGGVHGQCYDSPLYLYGKEGQQISVRIHTPVSETNPQQSGQFTATILSDNLIKVDGSSYDSIDFNYTPAIKKLTPPKTGVLIKNSDVENTLVNYAQRLGLNENETADLVEYGKSVATGTYVFVSFFDHETSHAILPITFDPNPDSYRNIVFYFKNLSAPLSYSPKEPTFEKIRRKGFTAVEISGIVE